MLPQNLLQVSKQFFECIFSQKACLDMPYLGQRKLKLVFEWCYHAYTFDVPTMRTTTVVNDINYMANFSFCVVPSAKHNLTMDNFMVWFFCYSLLLHPKMCFFSSHSMYITHIIDLPFSSFVFQLFLLITQGFNSCDSTMIAFFWLYRSFCPHFPYQLNSLQGSSLHCSLFVTCVISWVLLQEKHSSHLTFQWLIDYWGTHLNANFFYGMPAVIIFF